MRLAPWLLVLSLMLAGNWALADHRDVCAGFSDSDDQLACYVQADQQLDQLITQNPQLFSADALVKSFIDNTRSWATPLLAVATAIFWSLALFELILTFSMMAIRGSDLGEFAVEFLTRILIISFGAYLLSNHAILFSVLDGFRDTASIVRTGALDNNFSLGRLLQIPLDVVTNIYTSVAGMNPVTDIVQIAMILAAAVIVLWALAVASIQLILVLCEMYIVITIGLFSLGLYSLKITREYPMRFFGGLIGTGFKLLALELIISVGLAMVEGWADMQAYHKAGPYLLMAAAAIMYKEIAVRIPDYIQSLLTASPGSGVSAAGAVTAAGAVAGAGLVASRVGATGAMSVRDAVAMARTQGATGAGGVAVGAARNLIAARVDTFRRSNPAMAQLRENLMAAQAAKAMKPTLKK